MKTIAVITGTRAEYGLLVPVLDAIQAHPKLALKLIVTGTHLTTQSIKDIRHPIAARVTMQSKKDTKKGSDPFFSARSSDVQALGRGVAGIGKTLDKIDPDVVLVLGDRIEALAGALAGQVGGRRVAHIHGGDRAEGVSDEAMRHAISKLAHLHFAATAQSRRRLIRMGESPAAVFQTGSPAVDALQCVVPDDDAPELIIMHHPVGGSEADEQRWMSAILKATARHKRVVMSPNHDPGRAGIVRAIRSAGLKPIDHLPRPQFLSMLAGAKALVGNSSAGLIEAAALRTPAVNVGPRQAGRERPKSVIDAKPNERAIRQAIKQALSLDTRRLRHPYGDGHAGQRIADRLASLDPKQVPLHKHNTY